jgi:hypothetical protein
MTERAMFQFVLKPKVMATVLAAGAVMMALAGPRTVCAAGEPAPAAAQSSEAWQPEFDDVCSKTQDAMTFSAGELTALVQRCDALRPQIEKLDETQRKVYLGRLRMCRGLYAYVLDSKKNEKK